ncbi:hypothetical protein UK23_36645 [Lentzea aerocolonigenes]|uniref:Uncharacterized protein n=1 Tax=Lentzea aerocolonigenes TaxID=68170 RepID=A0A0F0GJ82_LENAE|nr:hypothetical protein [Lentzea aerocolonigenes]KJK42571.1 hypothetical protein UK23_36645 [Lentzea aerocolonigenes]
MAAGDYDPRAAVVIWHEVLNEVWEPQPEDAVFALPDALVAQLVEAHPARMHDVALSWAPHVDWGFHEAFAHLSELSQLARTAVANGETVYLEVTEPASAQPSAE